MSSPQTTALLSLTAVLSLGAVGCVPPPTGGEERNRGERATAGAEEGSAEPAEASTCVELVMPQDFRFRCLSGCFDPNFAANDRALEDVVESLQGRPGLARIYVDGFRSPRGPEVTVLGYGLAQSRADGVARALVRAGIDPALIYSAGLGAAAADVHPDTCPAPADDFGHSERRVEIHPVICDPPLPPRTEPTLATRRRPPPSTLPEGERALNRSFPRKRGS